MLAKEENKSVQNFIYDRIMPAQCQHNAGTKNDELVADLKRQLQKRRRNPKLHQLIDQSQKLLLNEQNKNQLLLSENIDEKKKSWWQFWK